MSWTRGTRQGGGGGVEGRVGKAISEERDKTATNSSSSSDGGIAKLERQTGTDKWTKRMEGVGGTVELRDRETDKHRRQLFTYKQCDRQAQGER